ncbi:MAG: glycerate kinase [Deltaproteobacteria bacterium]|nr:glycerate kinase [Deltaproteobacteria bacterium]
MKLTEPMKDTEAIFSAALKAVDPYGCIKENMTQVKELYSYGEYEELYVIAAGKGAYAMCKAAEEQLGDLITKGIAVTKYGHGGVLHKIKMLEASHPLPDDKGVAAGEKLIELLKDSREKTLLLCLISGGGSALLVAPSEGVSLEDKKKTTDLLLKAGAEIDELNCVRKHLSRLKGGRLAQLASPSTIISFILSDVIGDHLDIIASGPTSADRSTFKDALAVIEKSKIKDYTPPSVLNFLTAGSIGLVEETPKPGSEVLDRVKNEIVGNNSIALEAAKEKALALGYKVELTTSALSGEASKVASQMAKEAVRRRKSQGPGEKLCLLSGGETTVKVKGNGKGGRNMELALVFADKIKGKKGITLLSAGTDGTDGPTDAAGAIVDGATVIDAEAKGLDASDFLKNNDSYHFFSRSSGLFKTGPTGTNVMDIQVMIIEGDG